MRTWGEGRLSNSRKNCFVDLKSRSNEPDVVGDCRTGGANIHEGILPCSRSWSPSRGRGEGTSVPVACPIGSLEAVS